MSLVKESRVGPKIPKHDLSDSLIKVLIADEYLNLHLLMLIAVGISCDH